MSSIGTTESARAPGGAWRPTDAWLVGVVISVTTFWLFAQSLLTVMPAVQSDLGVPASVSTLAMSLAALFSGMFIVAGGGFSDRLGCVRILRIGLVVGLVGSAMLAMVPSEAGVLTSGLLLLARALQGISAAMVMPASMSLVQTYYDGPERQRALSFWSMGAWGGAGASALVAGFIATSPLGWRSIFWGQVLVSLLSLLLVRGTPETPVTNNSVRFDWKGMFLLAATLLLVNVYVSVGASAGWVSAAGLGLIALAAVFFYLFLRASRFRRSPLVRTTLFGNRLFSGAVASNFLVSGVMGAGTMVTMLLLQEGAGWSSFQAGLVTLGYLVAVIVTIRRGEKIMQRAGARAPMVAATIVMGAGVTLLALTFFTLPVYTWVAVAGFTLFGIGLGLYPTPSTDTALENVPQTLTGQAAGIYKMASSLGNAIIVAAAAAIMGAASSVDPAWVAGLGIFQGGEANLATRFAGTMGLLFAVLIALAALVVVVTTIPGWQDELRRRMQLERKEERKEEGRKRKERGGRRRMRRIV